jgi:hypothetical protein
MIESPDLIKEPKEDNLSPFFKKSKEKSQKKLLVRTGSNRENQGHLYN